MMGSGVVTPADMGPAFCWVYVCQGLVEYTNLQALDGHIVYVPYYLPGEHPNFSQPDEWFTEQVKGYLQRINPAIGEEQVLDIRASRYRYWRRWRRRTPLHFRQIPIRNY